MSRRWIYRPEIADYVIESYAGTEKKEGGPARRVFIWLEGDEIRMGNTEAFTLHLGEKFDLLLTESAASEVHALLRYLGERVLPKQEGKQRGAPRGNYRQPEPDSWIVGRVRDAEED